MSSYWAQKSMAYRKDGPKRWHDRRSKRDNDPITSTPTETPASPLGKLIHTLRPTDFDSKLETFRDSATIQAVQAVTSYNWVDGSLKGSKPTIIVPGKPPRWTPYTDPPPLREDDGDYFRDKNAARYPKHPIEPAVVALLYTNPHLATKTNIMACGSTLGNLLRFVSGQDKTFRMLVEKVDDTVFFVRQENSPTELIPGVRGYGHTFPEAYTTWDTDVRGSASHQRLVRYTFAGLDFIVRYEADGYIKDPRSEPPRSAIAKGSGTISSVDDFVGALSGSNVTPKMPKSTSTLEVKTGVSSVDQKDIFELKTRSIYTKFTKDHLAEELPRLWVSQIPNFILAFHTRGVFKTADIQIKDVRENVKKWVKDHGTDLTRLAALIHRIVDAVSEHPNHKIELSHQSLGDLDMREQLPDAGDALSPQVRARWGASTTKKDEKNEDSTVEKVVERNDSEIDSDKASHSDDDFVWDDEKGGDDFTACSADRCGYCGKCDY